MMEEETNLTSRFNEAQFQIYRLNNSWIRCKAFRTKGEFEQWRWELDTIWSELSYDAKRTSQVPWSKNETHIKIKALDKMIDLASKKNNRLSLYKYLDNKEKVLRWLQDEAGKGGSYDDGMDSMLG